MKKLSLAGILAVLAALAPAAETTALSGKWQIYLTVSGTERDQACTFTQKGADLTGTCNADEGPVQITGNVTNDKVTWTYKTQYNGEPLTVTYTGTRSSATKITGSIDIAEMGLQGEFTANQSK
jgi:hypothetical protein